MSVARAYLGGLTDIIAFPQRFNTSPSMSLSSFLDAREAFDVVVVAVAAIQPFRQELVSES